MAAITIVTGANAEKAVEELMRLLAKKRQYGKQSVIVNGQTQVWDVAEAGASKEETNSTFIELGTHIQNPGDILSDLTKKFKGSFGTTIKVSAGTTIGSVNGNVF